MSDYLIQQKTMEAIANQVRRLSNTDGLYNAVEIIEMLSKITGSLDATVGDIVIEAIDYDGTVLKSSTLCEGQVFAMPNPPSHEGLIFQGWTAPTTAINFVTAGSVGFSIGAMYSTESGATEIDVVTTEDNQDVNIPNTTGSNITYDWGDGSTSTGNHHTYSIAGSYTIKIFNVTEFSQQGGDISPIVEIRLGDSVTTINSYAFTRSGIDKISLSKNIETLGHGVFSGCSALKTIILPPKITEFTYSDNMFNGCILLEKVILPSNLKVFGGSQFFKECENLSNIILPNTIESIKERTTSYDNYYGIDVNGAYLEDNLYYYSSIDNKKFALVSILLPSSGTPVEIEIPDDVQVIQDGLFRYIETHMINKLAIPDNIKTIPKYMCYDGRFSEIILPSELVKINNSAFYSCQYVTDFNLPDTVEYIGSYAFERCSKLSTINLTDNLKYLGSNAFYATKLENIVLPSSIETLGSSIFGNCSSLISADLSALNNHSYMYGLFSNCSNLTDVKLPANLYGVDEGMFENCISLKNIDFLPSSLTEIGNNVFIGCIGLISVNIPDSVTSIDDYAFEGCTGLTEINLSNNLKALGSGVFNGCTGLTSFHIPLNLSSLEGNPIYNCPNIVNLTIDENNTKFILSNGCLISNDSNKTLCIILKDIDIPTDGSIKKLGNNLYRERTDLTSLEIPADITQIGDYCFYNCSNLSEIIIPNTVEIIGDNAFCYSGITAIDLSENDKITTLDAFDGCTSLISVKLPKNLSKIGNWSFSGCTSLASINIPKTVTKIETGAFYNCNALTSAVYEGTEEEWSNVTVGGQNECLTNVITFTEATETTTTE